MHITVVLCDVTVYQKLKISQVTNVFFSLKNEINRGTPTLNLAPYSTKPKNVRTRRG